jgi:hypothetical protein
MIRDKVNRPWTPENTSKRVKMIMNKVGAKNATELARSNLVEPATSKSIRNWLDGRVPSRYYSKLLSAIEDELGLI